MSYADGEAPASKLPAGLEEFLRPCRDLAANWNVDIVSKLTAYLAELDIDISSLEDAEFNRAQVNFQHAALVIEGGTCVYSRKVDYLYGLVFAAADSIYEARGKPLPSDSAVAKTSPDEDEIDGSPASDEVEFLLLDDVLKKNQPDPDGITLPLRDLRDSYQLQRNREANRIVSVPLHLLPSGPQRARRTSIGNPSNSGLRMPEARINAVTGALILDGIGAGMDPESAGEQAFVPSSGTSRPSGPPEKLDVAMVGEDSSSVDDAEREGSQLEDDPGDTFVPDISVEADFNLEANMRSSEACSRAQVEERQEPTSGQSECSSLPSLDPHDTMGIPKRPAVCRRTWTTPDVVLLRNVKSATSRAQAYDEGLSMAEVVLGPLQMALKSRTSRYVSTKAVETAYKSRMKSLAVAKRKRTKLRSAEDSTPGRWNADLAEIADDLTRDADPDANSFDFSSAHDDDVGLDPDRPESDNLRSADIGTGDDCNPPGQMDALDAELRECVNDGLLSDSDNQIEKMVASYEESCRRYLHESSILWQEHAIDSQLEQRVADWRLRIEPLLALEEQRDVFDIKECGAGILHRFEQQVEESKSTLSDMPNLFRAREPYEVCRSFLALLQLVNNYKLDIVGGPSGDLNPCVVLIQESPNSLEATRVSPSSHSEMSGALQEMCSNESRCPKRGSSPSGTPRRGYAKKRHRRSSDRTTRAAEARHSANSVGGP